MTNNEFILTNFNRFKRIQEQSIKNQQKEIESTIRLLNTDYYRYINILRKKLENNGLFEGESLLEVRIAEYYYESIWILYSVVSGGYHQAYREMRFLLEAWLQASYMDRFYIGKTIKEKIQCKELENLYGGKLIDKVFDPKSTVNSQVTQLYRKLCKFVHSSLQELTKFAEAEHPLNVAPFYYNREEFERSIKDFRQLHEYLMKMII